MEGLQGHCAYRTLCSGTSTTCTQQMPPAGRVICMPVWYMQDQLDCGNNRGEEQCRSAHHADAVVYNITSSSWRPISGPRIIRSTSNITSKPYPRVLDLNCFGDQKRE